MINAISLEPLRALTRRAACKIPDKAVAERFQALALAKLLKDESNFRPAMPGELKAPPDWAQRALERGDLVHIAHPSRGAAIRLHNVARRLGDTCKLAAFSVDERPKDAAHITQARAFLDKIDRADFDVTARKALYYARLLALWIEDIDSAPVCEPATADATPGRSWRRVQSISELRVIGREFYNCLARTTRGSSYGAMLRSGRAQFWVLRDASNAGMMVVMAPAPNAPYFTEVRGPRNARVNADDPDLQHLAAAIGIKPRDPPKPPTPTPPRPPAPPRSPAEIAAAIRARLVAAPGPDLVAARVRLLLQMRTRLLRSARAI